MTMGIAEWSQLSDVLIQSAIVVFTLAMVAYAAETALRVRTSRASEAGAQVPVAAGIEITDASPSQGSATSDSVETIDHKSLDVDDPSATTGGSGLVGRVGTSFTVLAVSLTVLAIVARSVAAGRAPWGNMYEFAVVGAAAAGLAYLAFLSRQPIRDLGVWIVGLILLTLGLAVTVLYTPADALVPVLNSYWLVVHVAAAITSGGLFTVGFVATALSLFRSRGGRTSKSIDTLDHVSHSAIMFAFPIWTFAVMAGAIWAENAWGRYWGWDPKETWAFITWVFFAAYLHAKSTAGWKGSRASWLAIAGYLAFLFNFFGVNMWIPGLHSYAGV